MTPAKEVEDTVEELWNEYAVPSHPVGKEPKLASVDPNDYRHATLRLEQDFDWGS